MKFLFTVILLIVSCTIAFAQGGIAHPATPRLMVDADGNLISKTNPLPVDAEVSIGSVTVDVFPVYADLDGNPATASVDLNNHALVNIGSETIGLVSAIDAAGVNASETVIITKLDEILDATASQTALTASIDAVTTEVSSPTEWAQQTVNLTAATAADITTGITGSRKFIIVKSQDTSKQFWVSVDGAAVIGTNGMLVQDWVKLDAPETVTISVISSQDLDLSVMEAGY